MGTFYKSFYNFEINRIINIYKPFGRGEANTLKGQ